MGLSKTNVENAWLTLIGIKLLETSYEDSKPKWRLVANKGRKALKTICGLKGDVNPALSVFKNLNLSYY